MSSKTTLPIEELRNTPEYAVLTPKMKGFIEAYVESRGDILDAIRTAYDCKGDKEEKIVSWQIMRHPKIISVLEVWTNRDEKQIFIDKLKELLRLKDVPHEKVRLMELQARIMGWDITTQKLRTEVARNNATLKIKRERNISRMLAQREKEQQKPPEPEVEKHYDLSEFEALSDGDRGNGESSGKTE